MPSLRVLYSITSWRRVSPMAVKYTSRILGGKVAAAGVLWEPRRRNW